MKKNYYILSNYYILNIKYINMKEIKIKYTWKNNIDNKKAQTIWLIEILEDKDNEKLFLLNQWWKWSEWELIWRDLFLNIYDKNGAPIYENDVIEYEWINYVVKNDKYKDKIVCLNELDNNYYDIIANKTIVVYNKNLDL